jgi:hypothetical protein
MQATEYLVITPTPDPDTGTAHQVRHAIEAASKVPAVTASYWVIKDPHEYGRGRLLCAGLVGRHGRRRRMTTWPSRRSRASAPGGGRVLVVSASVGGGHDGVAHELVKRPRVGGRRVDVVDALDLLPGRLGHLLCRLYRRQLMASWSWGWVLASLDTSMLSAVGRGVARLALRRLNRDLHREVADITATGTMTPVVVCGHNDALRARLLAAEHHHVLGWVDDMAAVIRACDVVVQIAGGLTAAEALASGVPVLAYRCLPGHGRTNATALDAEGRVPWIRSRDDLAEGLTGAGGVAAWPEPGDAGLAAVAALLPELTPA